MYFLGEDEEVDPVEMALPAVDFLHVLKLVSVDLGQHLARIPELEVLLVLLADLE